MFWTILQNHWLGPKFDEFKEPGEDHLICSVMLLSCCGFHWCFLSLKKPAVLSDSKSAELKWPFLFTGGKVEGGVNFGDFSLEGKLARLSPLAVGCHFSNQQAPWNSFVLPLLPCNRHWATCYLQTGGTFLVLMPLLSTKKLPTWQQTLVFFRANGMERDHW